MKNALKYVICPFFRTQSRELKYNKMKLCLLLLSGMDALLCEHRKLTDMAETLKKVKHSTDINNEGSRFWAAENNRLRLTSFNLTRKIEDLEANIGYCTDLLVVSEENNRLGIDMTSFDAYLLN